MGSVMGCGLPGDLITIKYKVAALFFFLSCFWPLEVCMCCGGVALAGGGVSRRGAGRLHSRAVIHVGVWWPFPPGR